MSRLVEADVTCTTDAAFVLSSKADCAHARQTLNNLLRDYSRNLRVDLSACATTTTTTLTSAVSTTASTAGRCYGKLDHDDCPLLDCDTTYNLPGRKIDPAELCQIKCNTCPASCLDVRNDRVLDDKSCVGLSKFCGQIIPGKKNVSDFCPGTCNSCPALALRGWSSHHFQSAPFFIKKKWGKMCRICFSQNFCWAEIRPKTP